MYRIIINWLDAFFRFLLAVKHNATLLRQI